MPPFAGLGGAGWQLKRIHFVPARNQDAHSAAANLAELGLIPLNDPLQQVTRPPPCAPRSLLPSPL